MNIHAPHAVSSPLIGILLAGGRGSRFDPTGAQNKLLARLARGPDAGKAVAFVAARRLCAVLDRVIAVVRPQGSGADELRDALTRAGCEVLISADATRGMGASLAAAVRHGGPASGWVIALADMPELQPTTIWAVSAALVAPGSIAAACYAGRRGHPVGFGAAHRDVLLSLDGDQGPRNLFDTHPVTFIDTQDPGVLLDIDTPDAL